MEVFILAAVSLAIAISSLFIRKRNAVHLSFAVLCLSAFIYKLGQFLNILFHNFSWQVIEISGILAVTPAVFQMTRCLIRERTLLSKRHIAVMSIISFILTAWFVLAPTQRTLIHDLSYWYMFCSLAVSYALLIVAITRKAVGVERTRLVYLAFAIGLTVILSVLDLFYYVGGYAFPPLSNIFIAILIYFTYAVITHPQLMELREFMARMLVKVLMTFAVTTTLFIVIKLFAATSLSPFTLILLASFLIIISIEPTKQILKALLNTLFPQSKDVFDFLYTMDLKLEKEKSVLLEEMAPVLAHEIRNPLGSIKGAAQYLRSEASREEDQKLLDVIIEEVNRLNSVVTQFLNYAKPYNLNLKHQDINQLVAKAVSIIRMNNLADHVTIEQELRPDLPAVQVDAEQMIQVILNISLNAIEAMPEGGKLNLKTKRIDSDTGETVRIAIRDTGRGIRKEDIRNIFKPFFTTRERGVGLGLAICDRIIRNYGGTIRAKSIPGQGSIFHIHLNAVH
ncbi:MAG: Adaptive-response sensory-kinase SasA [Syntrophus sp. SKADARSKE-3]|nr:Adaptive-response sensory-kinase SasA [Syntrophus sp. SKADARSKE-3]